MNPKAIQLSEAQIRAALPKLYPEERAELEGMLLHLQRWRPLPGKNGKPSPQQMAFDSEADVIGFGGAAGAGKTDLALGLALQKHRRSLILRREAPQLKGIVERAKAIYGPYGPPGTGQPPMWRCRFDGIDRTIETGSCQFEPDKDKYQGRPHDLKVFDEAANFLEKQVTFIMGWTRHEDPAQKCQNLLPFNPPNDAEGEWILRWFSPWLDDKYPNPAAPGELRWFSVIDERFEFVEDGRPFVIVEGQRRYEFDAGAYSPEGVVKPRSITFIPGRVSDNPHYASGPYMAVLQSMPEPLRSRLLYGDMRAGRTDQERQVIPTEWVRLAQDRWEKAARDGYKPGKMDAIGVDVARGGKDKTVYSPRHRNWFAKQISKPGKESPDGEAIRDDLLEIEKDGCTLNIDVVGVGSSPYDMCKSHKTFRRRAVPMNGAEGTDEKDEAKVLDFKNCRALWYWRLREALDPKTGDSLMLPPDPELRADLCAATWKPTAQGILIEDKDAIIKRLGRSPDKGDSLVNAHASVYTVMRISDDAVKLSLRRA